MYFREKKTYLDLEVEMKAPREISPGVSLASPAHMGFPGWPNQAHPELIGYEWEVSTKKGTYMLFAPDGTLDEFWGQWSASFCLHSWKGVNDGVTTHKGCGGPEVIRELAAQDPKNLVSTDPEASNAVEALLAAVATVAVPNTPAL